MNITYPTWKVTASPTPNDTLFVCPKCGKAAWGAAGVPGHCYSCEGRKGGFVRCRAATSAETAEGKRCLKKIIGERPTVPAPATPGDNDGVEALTGYLTVALVADLFGVEAATVAKIVWNARNPGNQHPTA